MRQLRERTLADGRLLRPYPGGLARTASFLAGAAVAASGTPNVKGAWVEQVASLPDDVSVMEIFSGHRIGTSGFFTGMLLDLGIGASGSEVPVIENIVVGEHMGGLGELSSACRWGLPLHLPAGARLSARIQANTPSDTYQPVFTFYHGRYPQFEGFTRGTSLAINAGSSSYPTVGNLTNNAWTEIVASTTEHYHGLTAHFCGADGLGMANAILTVDLGMGGPGSEVVLATYRIITSVTETITDISGPLFVDVEVPVGSRLALRKNSTATLGGNIIGWAY